jgi:farnesyl-diphosphate farnesyltransferase
MPRDKVMDSHCTSSESGPVTRELLASVSRSFYLSLRVLPGPVRHPLSLSYLLARATDTVADTADRAAAWRLGLLGDFRRALDSGAGAAFLAEAAACAASVEHAGEQVLLRRLPECFREYERLPAEQRRLVRAVLGHIIRGQSLDLERFPDALRLRALPHAAALEEYSWLVAGCVGEFWTATCAEVMPRFAAVSAEEMIRWGVRYGQGLQLVNILRDLPGDARIGRCYLPEDELRAAGLGGELSWPAADWSPWHEVRRRWLPVAREWLGNARPYVRNLRSFRLRLAALLPMLIGEATLDLLERQPATGAPEAAKVNRAAIRAMLRRGMWLALRPPRHW